MKLKQFLAIFEAKTGSQKPKNEPAKQGMNMKDVPAKKDKDTGFIKPGSGKQKEARPSLENFKQMGKWNYVKGCLMSLAVPYVSHKCEPSGDITVQIDPEWCKKNEYKCGKDGLLDKKFYEFIEENGFKTETISFVCKQIEDKKVTDVVTQ